MKRFIKHILIGLFTAAGLATPVWAAAYQGVDIAHYSYAVDFTALKASGHGQFVYIKTSEGGSWQDPKWPVFTAGAKNAGIPFGYYHYFHSGTDVYGAAQATAFWNLIRNTGYSLVPAVDVEETGGNDAPVIQSSLRAFVDQFYSLSGQKPILYASTAFINTYIGSHFTDCLLWQAHYGTQAPGEVVGWGHAYSIWQYSGDRAYVSGIDNPADLDVAADARIFLHAQATGSHPAALSISSAQTSPNPCNTSDYYMVSSLPQAANSRATVDFYIRDRSGNRIGKHQVNAGDPLIVLGVDHTTRLAEVLYPNDSAGGWCHGYIRHIPSRMHYTGYYQWRNGKTYEPTYTVSGTRIGTIFPYERATILKRCTNGCTLVLYDTAIGKESKSGYVRYPGN